MSEQPVILSPADSRLVSWVHFVLGCSVLLPWNVVITATPFFLSRLSSSPLRSSFASYLTTSFTAANFLFLAHATMATKHTSPSRQTRLTILLISILTLLLTLSTFTYISAGLFFAFVLINGMAQATAGAYLQTSVIAVASLFGSTAVQQMMSGQAAVAVAVSGVQVLSALASTWNESLAQIADAREKVAMGELVGDGSAEEKSARIFFALSTVFLGASAIAHTWLVKSEAYRLVVGGYEDNVRRKKRSRRRKSVVEVGDEEERRALVTSATAGNVGNESEQVVIVEGDLVVVEEDEKSRIWRIAKANVLYEVAVAYVFVVTLAVYPPITTSISPTNPATHPLLFSALHFFLFNVGDFAGRIVCSFPRLRIWSRRRLLFLSLLRTLFIPLFLMCNIQRPSTPSPPALPLPGSGSSTSIPGLLLRAAASSVTSSTDGPVISSDVLFFLLLTFFGLSNGYTSSMLMIAAPSLAHNPRLKGRQADVDVAATVASFCLVGGLVLGSAASFGVRGLVCGCNPFKG